MKQNLIIPITVLVLLLSIKIIPQEPGRLRGIVTDSTSGETLAFCNVFINELNSGSSSNERGIYLINAIPSDREYQVTASYVGYRTHQFTVFIKPGRLTQLDIKLVPLSIELQTVEKVGAKIIEKNTTDLGLERISIKQLEILPKGVETDVMRSLQFLPGVRSTGDVSARYYVRGGTSDQNLVVLNGINIYNPFHSLGLFSVIEPDIINSVEFFKGGFSSEYGERISSVLNVITKDGNKNSFGFKGSTSLLTAKGMLEGPIPGGSFLVSGRKSHSNNVLKKFLNDKTVPIDFYDMSFKLNYSSKDFFGNAKFSLFTFLSGDDLVYEDPTRESFKWNNNIVGFEWLQIYDVPIFSRLGVSLSQFEGNIDPKGSNLKPVRNQISDFSLSFDINVFFSNKDEIAGGIKIKTIDSKLFYENQLGVESDLNKFAGNVSFYGKYKFLRYDNFGADIGTRINVTGLNSNSGFSPEPRLSITYRIFPTLALKASWGIYLQELVTVSDENEIISVFEPWIIIPSYLEPTRSINYSAGLEWILSTALSAETEVYYKKINSLPIVNEKKYFEYEPDLVKGKGESYGYEFMIKYSRDPFNVTGSYSLSWAYKELEGLLYYPKYDARHTTNILFEFNLGAGWIGSAVWSFSSGLPFTELVGFYDKYYLVSEPGAQFNNGVYNPYLLLGDRNLGRLPEYHRLDLGITKKLKLFFANMELSLNLINAYDRKNIFYFERDTGEQINMLPLLLTGTLKVEL
ncbi:MAG: TonB-dependent receptor [Ignavibacterium sp.]|nr:TonB-dependent receptor [Ignavibacterium sp.]